jgi:hypothetical protein
MLRSLISLLILFGTVSVFANDDNAWVGSFLQKKMEAKSVTIHFDGKGFIARVNFSADSAVIIAGGIGESKFEEVATASANLNASVAAASFREGKFATGLPIAKIHITTALAQKGEWLLEKGDIYVGIKIFDADKIIYAE